MKSITCTRYGEETQGIFALEDVDMILVDLMFLVNSHAECDQIFLKGREREVRFGRDLRAVLTRTSLAFATLDKYPCVLGFRSAGIHLASLLTWV